MTDEMIRLKGMNLTADRRLDRIPEFDHRSRSFGISEYLPTSPPRSYTWRGATVLDQGREGACVGFGWSHELISRPMVVAGVNDAFALSVYHEAQQLDEFPGDDYSGTSVLAGAKAVQARGHMKSYRWAFGLNDLILALGYAGPVVLGLNWYTGMMNADAEGFIKPTGQIEGGHCICAMGVSVSARRIQLVNSWGSDWGQNGHCWVSFDDMTKLLSEQGEACIPVERLKVVA